MLNNFDSLILFQESSKKTQEQSEISDYAFSVLNN